MQLVISSAGQGFCISCDPICQFLLSLPERRRTFLYLGLRRAWCWPAEPEVSWQWRTIRRDGSGEQGWRWLGHLYLSAWSVWANHHVPRDGTVRTAAGLLKPPRPVSGERVTECDESNGLLKLPQNLPIIFCLCRPCTSFSPCLMSICTYFLWSCPISYVFFFFLSILFHSLLSPLTLIFCT